MRTKKILSDFYLKRKMFFAFKKRRRDQMWLDFEFSLSERLWFAIFKFFFSKNMIHERRIAEDGKILVDDVFLFRNEENAEKFRKAQKLDWRKIRTKEIGFWVRLWTIRSLRLMILKNFRKSKRNFLTENQNMAIE